jgi:hypothetical protein
MKGKKHPDLKNWFLPCHTSVNRRLNQVPNPIPNYLVYEKVISQDIINIR